MCFFLSSETKLQFLKETVDRTNSSSKISSILDNIPDFMIEMEENMNKYRKRGIQSILINMAISAKYNLIKFLAFIINKYLIFLSC